MSFPAEKASTITAITLDVDGVLTDGRITYTDDGREIKSFNVQDGAAIKMLMNAGVNIALITGRRSAMVERRASELGIEHVYQGNEKKTAAFQDFLSRVSGAPAETMHVGDDLPDLALFELAHLGISVPNGHPTVRSRADWVTETSGGNGVVRELAERLLRAQGKWPY